MIVAACPDHTKKPNRKSKCVYYVYMWHIYIAECADGTLYTGITTDLKRRMAEHNGHGPGAKYTSGRRPVKLMYSLEMEDKSAACKEEWRIKKLSREEKMDLIKI